MFYLYIKQHNQTGLKYLGKTTQNPYLYKGSGKRWINHIKKHGYDVTTEIVGEYETIEELREVAKQLSEKFDITNSIHWANLRPEEGDGGDTSSYIDYELIAKKKRGKTYEEMYSTEEAVRLKRLRGETTRKARAGKTWEDIFGKEQAEIMRRDASKRTTERNLTRTYTPEHGEKISKAKTGKKHKKILCSICQREISINNLSRHQKTH
jgi:hypothetical protein